MPDRLIIGKIGLLTVICNDIVEGFAQAAGMPIRISCCGNCDSVAPRRSGVMTSSQSSFTINDCTKNTTTIIMPIDFEDCSNQLRRIILTGRLDIPGTAEIDIKFASMSSAAERRLVVDLTGVSFLASMGIRSLVSNAKAQQHRGGRMVLFVGENAPITKTLKATGIDVLIPMFTTFAEAEKAALA